MCFFFTGLLNCSKKERIVKFEILDEFIIADSSCSEKLRDFKKEVRTSHREPSRFSKPSY